MNTLANNINVIHHSLIRSETYSDSDEKGNYTITYTWQGKEITVKARPLNQLTKTQVENGDYPVQYLWRDMISTSDIDDLVSIIAHIFAELQCY